MRKTIVILVAAIGLASPIRAQGKAEISPTTRSWTFEVVSIRENNNPVAMPQFGPTPNGYRAIDTPILAVLVAAYVPQTGGGAFYRADEMAGIPDWMRSVRFDIEAKVAEADLADWKKPALQDSMLRSMLQAMLADRFGVKVHRESTDAAVYLLEVGKGGLKFKETDPQTPPPAGMALPGGTVVATDLKAGQLTLNFYGASMGVIATFFSTVTGCPVQDKTGLTGRYDVQLQKPAGVNAPAPADGGDPGPSVFTVAEGLGLKLQAAKAPVEMLAIDHANRPSAN